MKIYLITNPRKEKLYNLLVEAANKHNLEVIKVTPELGENVNLFDEATESDLVYRIATNRIDRRFESALLSKGLTSIYKTSRNGIHKVLKTTTAYHLFKSRGIPTPESLIYIPKDIKELENQVNSRIGGFPVIVKVSGGSKGIGVIKVDSPDSLRSLLDYLDDQEVEYMVNKFIQIQKPVHSYRGAVLGGEVVFAYKNESVSSEDFRSNTNQNERNRTQVDLNEAERQLIIGACDVLGFEMGGVDFVYDESGQIYIFEVNTPFNFGPLVEDIGFPFHEKLIDYLVNKAEASN